MLGQQKQAIRNFTEQYIVPQEPVLLTGDASVLNVLSRQARELGLWGQFYPISMGGKITSWLEYQALAEEEGRSEWGPSVFGTQALLDIHLLSRFGHPELQTTWLPSLVRGDIVGAYGMSEPQSIGSVPSTITTHAKLQDGYWVINGGKWFVSRAKRAAFMIVIAKTDEHAPPAHAFSMLLVPMQAEGIHRGQDVCLLGRDLGQAELTFHAVKVPQHHVIGQPGQALMLMQERLKLGRLMNASHWIGLAQRCFDDMCLRITSARGLQARLPSKQLVRQHVFNVYQAIGGARAHAKQAAETLHHGVDRLVDIHVAKVSASQALSLAADSAVQIFGAEGLNDANVLSSMYRLARTTRILDGADEVLINAAGRDLLKMHGLDVEHA